MNWIKIEDGAEMPQWTNLYVCVKMEEIWLYGYGYIVKGVWHVTGKSWQPTHYCIPQPPKQ